MTKKIILMGISLLLFLTLRYLFSIAPVERLDFLLWPVDKLVGFWFTSPGTFEGGVGYLHPDLQMVIGKSCSGSNFFLTAFLMVSFLGMQAGWPGKWLLFPFSLVFSWGLTLIANSCRIVSFLVLQHGFMSSSVLPMDKVHTVTGVVVYFTFLVLASFLLRLSVLKHKIHTNEKVA